MGEVVLWGFVATMLLTSLMAGAQAAGITRMDITFMLGTMFTPYRDRARIIGFLIHMMNGWIFAFVYWAIMKSTGMSGWWIGATIGVFHALIVLVVLMPLMPGLHPRMASDFDGPDPTPALEPPGILALNYGYRSPLVAFVAHLAFGILLGIFLPV